MASIQFRGVNAVSKAFEDRGADAWSVWDGKAFLFRGIGIGDFETLLKSLENSGSTAIYTLKVYDDITEAKKIKPSTECDGSFNFRLFERNEDGSMPGFTSSTRELEKRFNALEEKLLLYFEGPETEETEPENKNDLLGVVTGLLQDPDKLEKLIQVGHRLLGGSMQPAYVGQVNKMSIDPSLSPSNTTASMTPEQKEKSVIRLGAAIDTLEKNDPLIVEHLEKLATMAATKPDQFKMLLGMLDLY